MNEQDLQQAIAMHEAGITWLIVASYFKTTTETLRRKLKQYEQTNQQVH